jgi:hypothetical protein
MHQNQWLAAIEGLHADGLHQFQIPTPFPLGRVMMSRMHTYWNLSRGTGRTRRQSCARSGDWTALPSLADVAARSGQCRLRQWRSSGGKATLPARDMPMDTVEGRR